MELAVDLGSSSKKYGLYRDGVAVAQVRVEKGDSAHLAVSVVRGDQYGVLEWPAEDYRHASKRVVEWLVDEKLVLNPTGITSVGMRIVAPGKQFAANHVIDAPFIAALRKAAFVSPLHVASVLDELSTLRDIVPHATFMAVSDSAFHTTLPDVARRYAIPEFIAKKHELYRTGYHGLSVQSVLRQLERELGHLPKRVVVCHLGSGASVTAVQGGKSVDTSMGFTPLAGLPMATRVGDIDPGIILSLLGHGDYNSDELRRVLTEDSGLKALSSTTGDMKLLLEKSAQGDAAASFAVESFCYHVRQYIGAYAATLGGLDALVLTGTICERSSVIRSAICKPLGWLEVTLHESKNTGVNERQGGRIELSGSQVYVAMFPTNELAEIARAVAKYS